MLRPVRKRTGKVKSPANAMRSRGLLEARENQRVSAAVSCAAQGTKTLLIEKHNLPGGVASSFKRGRFEFDPSVHEICDYGADNDKGHVRLIMEKNGVKIDWITVPDCYRAISTYSDGTPMDVTIPCGREAYIAADGDIPAGCVWGLSFD